MAQPTTVPEWADGGAAAITVPLSGTKALGFINGQRPPGQYLNWLFNLIYQWILYLQAQIFAGNVEVQGNLIVDGLIQNGFTTYSFSPAAFSYENTGLTDHIAFSSPDGGLKMLSGTTTATIPINGLPHGFTITAVEFDFTKTATTTTSYKLWRVDSAGTHLLASGTSTTAVYQTPTVTLGTPNLIGANASFYVEFGFGSTTDLFFGVQITGHTV